MTGRASIPAVASPCVHVSQRIDRPARAVYAYARDPVNLPAWAAGLGGSIEQVDGRWVVPAPEGELVVAFVPVNDLGVLDHTVVLPDGTSVLNPMRVLPDGEDECDVVFTLRRRPSTSDEDLERDTAAVARDLDRLKKILEAVPAG